MEYLSYPEATLSVNYCTWKPFINYYHLADDVQDLGIPINQEAWENIQSNL